MILNNLDTIADRLSSGAIIEQKNWKFIKELNSFSEESLNRIALVDSKREYTYRQMFRKWDRFAEVFSALGITEKNRSRAAMTGVPCVETISAYFGLNITGASLSMVYDIDLEDAEAWKNIVQEEHITDLILTDFGTSPELLHRIMCERISLGIRNVILMHVPQWDDFLDCYQKWEAEENYRKLRKFRGVLFMEDLFEEYCGFPISYGSGASSDNALIVHTSGTTTAVHKPVPMSDRALNESSRRLLRDERFESMKGTAVCVLFMKVSMGYAFFDMMCLPLAFGGKLVTVPLEDFRRDGLSALVQFGGNIIFAAPSMIERLINLPFRFDLSKVRFVFMGAGYVSIDAKKRFDKLLKESGTDTKVSVGYGMTELGGACLLSPPDTDKSMIGYPLPGVKVKIREEDTNEYYDPEDGPRTGGLLVSSAGISSGCLDGRKYFDPVEIDGDLYIDTNDLVFVNDDGSLSYAGRTNKYFVNQAGKRFDAGLVETAVAEQPGIESCGIAPVLDKREHDTVPALYVQMAGETKKHKAKLIQALKNVFIYDDRIKENNLPSWCVITDNIPYNESGKVDIHKILNNEIGGKAYRTEAEYSDGVLTDIRLVKAEAAPGQMTRALR